MLTGYIESDIETDDDHSSNENSFSSLTPDLFPSDSDSYRD